ncbi:MAG: thioesterase family protein [Bryobacteraceae bacterium]|nr:thioesterase family protein [Bryobacteraceae bacterium]
MAQIPAGARGERKLLVTNDVAINFLGAESARVLATPHLIGGLEITARDLVKPYLEPGFDTVGTHVDVRHLAATPVGLSVTFHAEIAGVEDRSVSFRVWAEDEKEKISEGTHERFIVNVERFGARVQAKARG